MCPECGTDDHDPGDARACDLIRAHLAQQTWDDLHIDDRRTA